MNASIKPTPWDVCHRCSNPHGWYKLVRFDDGMDEYDAYICKACAQSPELRLDRLEFQVRLLTITICVVTLALLVTRCHS